MNSIPFWLFTLTMANIAIVAIGVHGEERDLLEEDQDHIRSPHKFAPREANQFRGCNHLQCHIIAGISVVWEEKLMLNPMWISVPALAGCFRGRSHRNQEAGVRRGSEDDGAAGEGGIPHQALHHPAGDGAAPEEREQQTKKWLPGNGGHCDTENWLLAEIQGLSIASNPNSFQWRQS